MPDPANPPPPFMRSKRERIIATLQALPDVCAAYHPTGEPVMLVAGESGYHPARPGFDPKAFNERQGITPAQVNAMKTGSCFGWDCPGADPADASNTDPNNDPYVI